MFRKIIIWYGERAGIPKYFIRALVAFIIFYGGAALNYRLNSQLKNNETHTLLIEGIAIFVVFLIYILFTKYVDTVLEDVMKAENFKKSQLTYAYSQMDQLVSLQIKEIKKQTEAHEDDRNNLYAICLDNMTSIVKNAYQFFESHYGESEKMEDRIDFEVTFMTKSYNDKGITIPAFGNRKGRAPVSMKKRENNPNRYEGTITASLYREKRHSMCIIPDTSQSQEDYKELYPKQKERIKSSIVHPVLDDENKMLGALVVHCDKREFFKIEDKRFWNELLDIYAVRIALEKSRLDYYANPDIQKKLNIIWHDPF
ncbi:MAG TPA: GAF domain-containing protein [Ignavibacteria bacterium]|nr:GAF domain-containing protein [Ignavibacteria bacterium]